MIRATALCALLAGLPLAASGQSGTVRYDQATRIDFQAPPNMPREFVANIPKASVRPMQLRYTPEAALFGPAPAAQVPGAGASASAMAGAPMAISMGRGEMMVREVAVADMGGAAFFMGGPGGGGMDAVAGAFTNLSDGSYVEVRNFLGRTFRIPEARPSFEWKLTGEAASFLGYPVYQAIAKRDSTTFEAWFTPDIPVSAGPAQYGGLPGLILTLAVDSNRVVYTATAVDTTTVVGKVTAPTEGSKVTRAEYDKTVAEKMAEMAKSRRGRGN
jgi:hypothetical protein